MTSTFANTEEGVCAKINHLNSTETVFFRGWHHLLCSINFWCTNNSTVITQASFIKSILCFWPEQWQTNFLAISRYFVLNTRGSLPPPPKKVTETFQSLKRRTQIISVLAEKYVNKMSTGSEVCNDKDQWLSSLWHSWSL